MKKLITITALTLFGSSNANEFYEHSLFAVETNEVNFKTEQQFTEYIKTNMPNTYVYFQRLTTPAQKRVFTTHQQNTNQDITQLVLSEYRKRG